MAKAAREDRHESKRTEQIERSSSANYATRVTNVLTPTLRAPSPQSACAPAYRITFAHRTFAASTNLLCPAGSRRSSVAAGYSDRLFTLDLIRVFQRGAQRGVELGEHRRRRAARRFEAVPHLHAEVSQLRRRQRRLVLQCWSAAGAADW